MRDKVRRTRVTTCAGTRACIAVRDVTADQIFSEIMPLGLPYIPRSRMVSSCFCPRVIPARCIQFIPLGLYKENYGSERFAVRNITIMDDVSTQFMQLSLKLPRTT